MATISRLSIDLVANSASFRRELQKASKSSKKSFGGMMKSAKKATAAFAAVGVAAGAVFIQSAKTYGNFTEALQDVRAKTGATAAEIDKLSKSMRTAAKATKFTATETAQAGTFLAQAGFNIREINDALRPTLDLAAATKTSVQQTADFMTNIMKGMGMTSDELSRASDVLAVTTAKSNTNLTDLATAMSYASPSARAMGMSIEETSALLGSMANAGIKGSMAGTALRRTFSALSKGSKNLDESLMETNVNLNIQQKTLKRLGVNSRDADGKIRGLTAVLTDLKAAGGTEEDMLAIFGDRAGSAMMQFMNEGLKGAEDLKIKLDGATGAAERMSQIQLGSLNGDMKLFTSQLDEMQLILAENGLVTLFRSVTQSATKFMKNAEPALKSMAQYADEIAVGLVTLAGGVILGGIVSLTIAMKGLAAAMLMNPIGLLLVGFTALGVLIYKNLEYVSFHWKRFTHNIGVLFSNSVGNMSAGWDNLSTNMILVFSGVGLAVGKIINGIVAFFQIMIEKVFDGLSNLANAVAKFTKIDISFGSQKLVTFNKGMAHINKLLEDGAVTSKQHKDAVKILRDAYAEFGSRGFGSYIQGLQDIRTELSEGKVAFREAAQNTDVFISRNEHLANGIKVLNAEMQASTITAKQYTEAFNILQATLGQSAPVAASAISLDGSGTGTDVGTDADTEKTPEQLEADRYALELENQKKHLTAMFQGRKDWTAATVALQQASTGEMLLAGSKHSKKMLRIQQFMALKSIAMSTATGIAKALEQPFPLNIAEGIRVASAGAVQLSAVRGQFHDGIDNVPNTGTYLLEQGERVVDKRLNKDMSSFLANQNQGGNTTTNNPTMNFNVTGGDADNVEQMLMTHRGKFESMMRDVYNESAMNSPF